VSNAIRLEGFKELQAKLKKLPSDLKSDADVIVRAAAADWEGRAKRMAPVDNGWLQGGIVSDKKGEMLAEVTSKQLYSPYVEWGTGTRVKVPAELQSYAIQFKGVKKVIGRYPKPFFFVQKPIVKKELIERLKKLVSEGN
jgi:HK97 gp10 family phage protein